MFAKAFDKHDPLAFNQVGGLYGGGSYIATPNQKKSLLDRIKTLFSFIANLFSSFSSKPISQRDVSFSDGKEGRIPDPDTVLHKEENVSNIFDRNRFSPHVFKFYLSQEILNQLPDVN